MIKLSKLDIGDGFYYLRPYNDSLIVKISPEFILAFGEFGLGKTIHYEDIRHGIHEFVYSGEML